MAEEKLKRSRNLLPCPSQWVYNSSMQKRKQMCFQLLQPLGNASDYILSCLTENKRADSIFNRPVLMWGQTECLNHNLCRVWRNAEVILLAGKRHKLNFRYRPSSTCSQSRSDSRGWAGGQRRWDGSGGGTGCGGSASLCIPPRHG